MVIFHNVNNKGRDLPALPIGLISLFVVCLCNISINFTCLLQKQYKLGQFLGRHLYFRKDF